MNEKITLQDIVNLFSQKQGIGKKEADLIVRTMFDLIEEALKTENFWFFGLHRVNLIKGSGRNTEPHSTQFIGNISFTKQHLFLFTKHQAGGTIIDVLNDGGNGGKLF